MKIITVETLKTFFDELNIKYGTDFYSKAEADTTFQRKVDSYTKKDIDEKLKSGGGSIDLKELAERIPNFCYWLRLTPSLHQKIIATCDGKEYTEDVLIEKGKLVTLSVKADEGYTAGTLSKTEVTMNEDVVISVTKAFGLGEKKLVAGKFDACFNSSKGVIPKPLVIPDCVNVIKVYNSISYPVYAKVSEGMVLEFSEGTISRRGRTNPVYKAAPQGIDSYIFSYIRDISLNVWMYFEWSTEINEHSVDVDLTQAGNKMGVR